MAAPPPLHARHIQDHNQANTTQKHYFGYPSRVLPCTKDAGTCAYLDAVYWMQELHIFYSWILWAVLLGILGGWWGVRRLRLGKRVGVARGSLVDVWGEGVEGGRWRRRLGREFGWGGWLGLRGVSRLQVAVLVGLMVYLLVFSLVGVVYRIWITPVTGTTLHNTRTAWVAGISDRVGVLAFALTPLTILLSMRESVLSQVTGIPYQHFTFLHRWTGRIIFLQSFIHTLGWTVVEGKLYQPQPSVYREFMAQQYIIFGVVAMFLLTAMWVLSTEAAVRRTGYGVFKVVHWGLAVLYLGACWGHWDRLWCWIVPALALVVLDQVLQWGRTAYIHFRRPGGASRFGFQSAGARLSLFTSAEEGAVVRLDFEHPLAVSQLWQAGQHFMLCFPALSIWQSHPITIASLPEPGRQQRHTYLLRVRAGQTAKLAALGHGATTQVIMTGPYGTAFPSIGVRNILAVAGGTGVTFTLPIVLQGLREERWRRMQRDGDEKVGLVSGVVEFVWVAKKGECLLWLEEEMRGLKSAVDEYGGLRVKIFVTREGTSKGETSSGSITGLKESPVQQNVCEVSSREECSSGLSELVSTENSRWSVTYLDGRHPSMHEIVSDFVCRADELGGGAMEVLGSGPETMGSDLRAAVAEVKGRVGLGCYWDSR